MVRSEFEASNLWKSIIRKNIHTFMDTDLANFRNVGGINSRLASWGPIDPSTRYYKTLLLNFLEVLDIEYSKKNLNLNSYLERIKCRSLGNPVTVNFNTQSVCLDYALCLEELLFLDETLPSVSSILEVGGGFGRTCHAILSIHPHVSSYIICDLPEMLSLSQKYLMTVLPDDVFKKVTFIRNDSISDISSIDLSININSFQEMAPDVILNYLKFIGKNSHFLFVKNPTCKYDPALINLQVPDLHEFESVMSTGLCRDIVDIFDNVRVAEMAPHYISHYCPGGFSPLHDAKSRIHRHYHSVLYKRDI